MFYDVCHIDSFDSCLKLDLRKVVKVSHVSSTIVDVAHAFLLFAVLFTLVRYQICSGALFMSLILPFSVLLRIFFSSYVHIWIEDHVSDQFITLI